MKQKILVEFSLNVLLKVINELRKDNIIERIIIEYKEKGS